MYSSLRSIIAAATLLCILTGASQSHGAQKTSDSAQSSAPEAMYVIPPDMEEKLCEILPDDLELSGGFYGGDRSLEESTIAIELKGPGGDTIKVRLGHPQQLAGAWAETDSFAVRLDEGDMARHKAALDDLLTRIAAYEENWNWLKVGLKVGNIRPDSGADYLMPECSRPLQEFAGEAASVDDMPELLDMYNRHKTGLDHCDSWLLLEVMNRAELSIAADIEKLVAGLTASPQYKQLMQALGAFYLRNSEPDKAREMWMSLGEKHPGFAAVAAPLARQLVSRADLNAELAAFEKRLALNPSDVVADTVAGILKYYRRDYSGALPHLTRAATAEKTHQDIVALLIMTHIYLGDRDEAGRLLNEGLKNPQHSKLLYYCRARLYAESDPAAAAESVSKFIESQGVQVQEAAESQVPDVKSAARFLEYLKIRSLAQGAGADELAAFDLMAPWPEIRSVGTPAQP